MVKTMRVEVSRKEFLDWVRGKCREIPGDNEETLRVTVDTGDYAVAEVSATTPILVEWKEDF